MTITKTKLAFGGSVAMIALGLSAGAQNLTVVGKTQSGDGLFTGNLGLGIPAPSAKLEVAGAILQQNGTANVMQSRNTTGTIETWMWPRSSDNIMYTNFGANGWNIRTNASTPVMFMNNAGDVGVGTTAPRYTFEVNHSDADGKAVAIGNTSQNGTWMWMGPRGATNSYNVIQSVTADPAVGNLVLEPNGGNLGVGTTSPRYALDVAGSIGASSIHFGGDPAWQAGVGVGAAAANGNSISVDTIETMKNASTGALDPTLEMFLYNPGATLAIHGSLTAQNATISRDGMTECCSGGDYTAALAESSVTTHHLASLQFHNSGWDEGFIQLRGTNQGGPRRFTFGDHQGVTVGGEFTGGLTVAGRVGIGTTTPQAALQVNGSVRIGATMELVDKTGDNGSVSCATYCMGSNWGGWSGTCMAAFSTDNTPLACTATNATGLSCLCARSNTGVLPVQPAPGGGGCPGGYSSCGGSCIKPPAVCP